MFPRRALGLFSIGRPKFSGMNTDLLSHLTRLHRLADAVSHVPRVLVGDAQLAMQLHRRQTLEVRGVEVDGYAPLRNRKFRVVHDRVGLDGEVLAAIVRFASPLAPPATERTSLLEFRDFRAA